MSGAAPVGEQSGNYAGVIIAASVMAAILLVAASLWIHYHGA